jgi:pimeloyl-ACP methyl ester carboxylesterase
MPQVLKGRVRSPAVLVGHSYGGTVITAAGTDDRVARLVYIAALGPDETETSQGQQDKYPKTPVFSQIDVAGGRVWLKPSGIGCFCGTREGLTAWPVNGRAEYLCTGAHESPGQPYRS